MDLTTPNDLERQLILTEALWKRLRYDIGLQQGTPVRVEAFFYATDIDAAQALAAKWGAGWEHTISKVEDRDHIRITVLTPTVAFSRRMLVELSEMMVATGIETNCAFDGFQLTLRPPPAWWKFWLW